MSEFVKIICPVCGQSEYKKEDNILICEYCNTPFFMVEEQTQHCINEAHNAHALYNFTKADDLYRSLLENTESEEVKVTCYLGRLLAYFGIVYINDFNNNKVITFTNYDPNYKSIKESSFYKAIEKSQYFSKYQSMLEEFDRQYQNIKIELSKKIKYDLFICVKVSQKTKNNPNALGYTTDSKIADTIYHELTKRGLRVFYSEKSLSGINYDAQIYSALMQSSNLLVIATAKDYLESSWVTSEWRRWISFIKYDLKERNSLYLYRPNANFELPLVLKKLQEFNDTLSLINIIDKNVKPEVNLEINKETLDLEKELNVVKAKIIFKKYKDVEQIYMKLCEEFMDYRPWIGLFELLVIEKVNIEDERYKVYFEQALSLCKDDKQKEIVYGKYNNVFSKNNVLNNKKPEDNKKTEQTINQPVLTKEDYYNKALMQDRIHNREEAFNNYKKAAELGHIVAQNNLGYCYDNGDGVNKDSKQAVYWYQKAADNGLDSAQYNLAVCYECGEGIKKDLEKAKFWYAKAAEQNHKSAFESLERLNKENDKTSFDGSNTGEYFYNLALDFEKKNMLNSAFENYKKAALLGHIISQNNLGYCYENGEGVEKDLSQAIYWYKEAADNGSDSAKYNLGYCYEEGVGVIKDFNMALNFYKKAAEQGNKNAIERLKILKIKL